MIKNMSMFYKKWGFEANDHETMKQIRSAVGSTVKRFRMFDWFDSLSDEEMNQMTALMTFNYFLTQYPCAFKIMEHLGKQDSDNTLILLKSIEWEGNGDLIIDWLRMATFKI